MKALQCQYPLWLAPEDDPHGEPRETWPGKMRIVRSARRMHELRRRGVRLLHLGLGDGIQRHTDERGLVPLGPWAWFETDTSYERRALDRNSRRVLRRAMRKARAHAKLDWVEALMLSLRPVLVAPENPNGLTFDMSNAWLQPKTGQEIYDDIVKAWDELAVARMHYDLTTPEARAQAWRDTFGVP